MSKWLERARARKECLPPVPNVPIVPKVVAARSFGTIGSFGTGGEDRNGPSSDLLPGLQKVSPIEIDEAEREAIAIELGGVPIIYASAFAHLQAHAAPGVPIERWDQFINDAGIFLDLWGHEAERLGWRAEELFGLHPEVPMARYDQMGLIWMLKGEYVVALTATGARFLGGLTFYKEVVPRNLAVAPSKRMVTAGRRAGSRTRPA
jgi:hypothetical protein